MFKFIKKKKKKNDNSYEKDKIEDQDGFNEDFSELKDEYKNKLWCDLKIDKERIEFLQSGRAVETGIIAPAIVNDIVDVFLRCNKS